MATMKASTARDKKPKQTRMRLVGIAREIIKHRIAADYLEGKTLTQVAGLYQLTYGMARNLVVEAGVEMHKPGARRQEV